MKKSFSLILFICTTSTYAQDQIEVPKPSQMQKIGQHIGLTDIEITYSRPKKKEKPVFFFHTKKSLIYEKPGLIEAALKAAKASLTLTKAKGNENFMEVNEEIINRLK